MTIAALVVLATVSQAEVAPIQLGGTVPMGSSSLPLVDESLTVRMDGQHATTTLEQFFKNKTGRRIEGVYEIRTPPGTEVEGFSYWNGEQRIVGEVFEKSAARAIYEGVKQRRRDPGLLEKVDEGLFRFMVFPIEPGERKRVQVRYGRWLRASKGQLEYRGVLGKPNTHVEVIPRGLDAFPEVTSPTHSILKSSTGRLTLSPRDPGDKVVVRWQARASKLQASSHVHRVDGESAYLNVVLNVPYQVGTTSRGRDITLLVDRSGSMAGAPLRRAKEAALALLAHLEPTDRINVGFFDDHADLVFAAPQHTNEKTLSELRRSIERVRDGGGTDIAAALTVGLGSQADGERSRFILLLTDGRSDAPQAFAALEEAHHRARVFTIGLGNQVSKPMLSRLAATSGGQFTFVDRTDRLKPQMIRVLGQAVPPIWENTRVLVNGRPLQRSYPQHLPGIAPGDELRISGRVDLPPEQGVEVEVLGTMHGKPAVIAGSVSTARNPWAGRMWAKSRIDELMEEQVEHGDSPERTDELINLAVAYNVVTPHTAFLAIPEGEATALAKRRLESARDFKRRLLNKYKDAAALMSQEEFAQKTGGATQSLVGRQSSGTLGGGRMATSKGIAGIGSAGRAGGGGFSYGTGSGGGGKSNRGMIRLSKPAVLGSLPPDVIKRVINSNKNQIRYCYEVQLQRNPQLEGRILVKWVISAVGRVAKVQIAESTMNSSAVERCIMSKIKNWKFPAPAGGGIVEVRYPFVFRAN